MKKERKIEIMDFQDIQDDIFQKMSVSKKLKLVSDFSMFILKLNKLGKEYGISRIAPKNR